MSDKIPSIIRFSFQNQSRADTYINSTYEVIPTEKATGVRFYTSVDPGSYVAPHWHPAIEIVYLLEGDLSMTVESASRQYHAGDCILVNPDVIHSTKCTAPNKAIVFQIPLDFVELYIPEVRQLVFSLDVPSGNAVQGTKLEIFKDTLLKMQIVNDVHPEGFILRFNSLLFEILFQLYHNFSMHTTRTDQSRKEKDRARLNTVLTYTQNNYNRPLSIDEVAQTVYLQPGYFCRFFKKNMGVTFLEYQNELRLSYIYHDLITTDDSLQSILERHGFTNYKLFRRMFSEHFHMTPGTIRKKYRLQEAAEAKE